MAASVTADTEPVCSWSVWWTNGHFLMTCLSLNVWSCLPEERTERGHFLFAHPLFYWILLLFRVWEVSALWVNASHQVARTEQVFINQTFLFFNSFSSSPQILPFWPDEEQRHWVQAAGAEWGSSRDSERVVSPWALLVQGWPGLCSPFIPLPGVTPANCQEICSSWNCCTN